MVLTRGSYRVDEEQRERLLQLIEDGGARTAEVTITQMDGSTPPVAATVVLQHIVAFYDDRRVERRLTDDPTNVVPLRGALTL